MEEGGSTEVHSQNVCCLYRVMPPGCLLTLFTEYLWPRQGFTGGARGLCPTQASLVVGEASVLEIPMAWASVACGQWDREAAK